MAIITSSLFDDIRGTFGGAVFRRIRGKIVVSARPLKGTQKKATKNMAARRKKFKGAISKGKKLYYDPIKRAEYAVKCPPDQALWNFITSELAKEQGKA
jgi:hypothetical protein